MKINSAVLKTKLKDKRIIALGVVILMITVGPLLSKCTLNTPTKPKLTVQLQPVKIATINDKISAVGTLTAPKNIYLSAEVSGKVTQIAFVDGQVVQQGQLLFQLDNTKEQADLLSAQSAYDAEKNKYTRMQELLPSHYVSKQDLDAEAADLQAKLAAVKTTQNELSKKTITAPFSGEVGATDVAVGDYVSPGMKLVELVDRSVLKVDYSVPEKYFQQVKINQPVAVSTPDATGKAFWGKVVYIAPVIDPQTHTLALQASIPNNENILAPGLFVQISQVLRTNQRAILVPEESLVKTPDKTIVYRVINNKAIATLVTTGATENGWVEITSGLVPTDGIVTAGQQQLNDGDEVNVV